MGKPKRKPVSNSPYHAEFFKVILPHHLTSHKLLIPPDYIKNFSKTIQDRIALKDGQGGVWHVNVERIRDEVFISGWLKFVNDKGLSVGDFLVFQYDKSYSFLVKIFGSNGCKKDSSVANPGGTKIKVEKLDEEEEDYDDEAQKRGCKRACLVKEDWSTKVEKLDEEEDYDDEAEKRGCKRARVVKEDCSTSSESTTEITRGAYELTETNIVHELPEDCTDLIEAEPVAIAPNWAYFDLDHCILSRHYVQIPKHIIDRQDVRLEKEMVLCNSKGEQWPINVYTSNDGRVYFTNGWPHFRNQNNIAFGDACQFNFDVVTFTNRVYVNISHKR